MSKVVDSTIGASMDNTMVLSQSLPTGTNKIGGVAITDPLPAGTNSIGNIGNTQFDVNVLNPTNNVNIASLPNVTLASGNTVGVTSLPAVSLASGNNPIGSIIGSRPFEKIFTITRPAGVVVYAGGQVLSTAASGLTSFPACALGIGNTQRFIINSVQIISSNGSAVTKGVFAVHLFNVPNPAGGGFNDGSTFTPTVGALLASGNALIGLINTSLTQIGSAVYGYQLMMGANGLQGQTDSLGNVYVAIVMNGVYTSLGSEIITVKINGTY